MCDNEKNMRNLLCAMLYCDSAGLELLGNVQYDWEEVLEWLPDADRQIDFNALFQAVIATGRGEIAYAISEKETDSEAEATEQDLNDDQETKLAALKMLNPYQDVRFDFDSDDAHIRFVHNGSIYRKYLSDEIRYFERGVGLEIIDGEETPENK